MAVNSVQNNTTTSTTTTGSTNAFDKAQFMSLLVTQLQNQDPFNPMDNQQFVTQLAQLTSLEQLQSINTKLDDNMTLSQSLNNTMLLGLVGRQATVPGNEFGVAGGSVPPLKLNAAAAGTATIQVKDAAGKTVATYTRNVSAGLSDIAWDGRLSDGSVAADGSYTYSASVTDSGGTAVTANTYVTGAVDSLRFVNGIAVVRVAGREYYVSDIAQVGK